MMRRNGEDGIVGKLYAMPILPNTARQLVEAIQTQPDLSNEEALEMADYLDEHYNMSDYVPTTLTLEQSKPMRWHTHE